ncbi:nuclear protein UL24 [Human betaherpesvirus 5]|nr:nuclear protein UL24 [Human betaherpesvirus 5]
MPFGCGDDADSTGNALRRLPHVRKRIGKRKHLDIYRRLLRVFPSFVALNRLLGGLFPPELQKYRRRLFIEVRLSRRIPDCVLVFLPPDSGSRGIVYCYVIEFKTTYSDADDQSVRWHATHSLQYAEGLRQLKGALVDFDFLRLPRGGGQVWSVVPSLVFFQQKADRPSFYRAFRSGRFDLCTDSVLDYLGRRQDESVAHLLAATRRRLLRAARGKRAALPRARASAVAGGRGGGNARRGLARGRAHGPGAQTVSASGAQGSGSQGADLLRGSRRARVRGGGVVEPAVRARRRTVAADAATATVSSAFVVPRDRRGRSFRCPTRSL